MFPLVFIVELLLFAFSDAGIQRIVGGTDAKEKEFPYSVSIRRTEFEEMFGYGNHICGGALIDNQTVITAAHCVFDKFGNFLGQPNSYTIAVGSIYRSFRETHEVVRTSKKIIVHPEYSMDTMYNDIALIHLNESIPIDGAYVNPVPLATKSFPEESPCVVSGWGHMKIPGFEGKFIAENMQKANVFILSKSDCAKNYTKEDYVVWEKQICVGVIGKEIDSCQGDSGGPLVCNGVLAALVSTGTGCATPGFPGIYTDIPQYLDFIQNAKKSLKLEENNIPPMADDCSDMNELF
uniref:limulus clotting factor C n=1 Tax=Dolopus genitalis TaxID=2488630 RepID=A0A3G5BIK3_DOLGE|nr:venom polypeptide [Dolopus genitalis]